MVNGKKVDEGMVLIRAAGKRFQMGDPDGDAVSKPVHTVSFTYDFYMDETEVTQKDYEEVIRQAYGEYRSPRLDSNLHIGDNYPIYRINYFDAALYCNARSKRDGFDTVYSYGNLVGTPGRGVEPWNFVERNEVTGYRLPTEAEWEFACRAGSTTDFFWGDEPSGAYANGDDHGDGWPDDGYGTTAPVGSYAPNPFGLYDMSGNVWEWCHEVCWDTLPTSEPVTDPMGPDSGAWKRAYRPLRGGCWDDGPQHLRSASRYCSPHKTKYDAGGFRVVIPVY
jgi:formylglycine-generating enzyme required for sulfatase activity